MVCEWKSVNCELNFYLFFFEIEYEECYFFLYLCIFYINCKRDRFLRIVLYSGKLYLLIFEKFLFEKMIVIM